LFGSVVLEVVLGLVFVYAWFSLACSTIVEFLESWRAQRGKLLATAIEGMLGAELRSRFYQHGLIQSQTKSGRPPSYLSARSFATVTLDLLGVGSAQFRSQLDAISGDVGTTLRALTKDAATYEQVVAHLEHWFDGTMDRCSGWFRRRARLAAFTSGLVVAALLNVDSLEIASALYSDTHLRLSVATQAEADGQVPIARRTTDKGPAVMNIPIESGTLPLGWENSRFATRARWAEHAWREPAFWFGPVLMKILGLVVTALAGTLGAAFWFDALRRFLTLRPVLAPNTKPLLPSAGFPSGPTAVVASAPPSRPSALLSGDKPSTLIGLEGAPSGVAIEPIVNLEGKPRD
jgi:hypothetical protein